MIKFYTAKSSCLATLESGLQVIDFKGVVSSSSNSEDFLGRKCLILHRKNTPQVLDFTVLRFARVRNCSFVFLLCTLLYSIGKKKKKYILN